MVASVRFADGAPVNNFWNNRNRPSGPLFAKKTATDTPQPSGTMAKPSTTRTPAVSTAPSAGEKVSVAKLSGVQMSASGKMRFDHDIACGAFVGAFEVPGWNLSLEVLEITDPTSGRVERCEGWLRPNDMLAILTREFGKARLKASAIEIRPDAPPQQRAQLTKERDEWTRRTNEMRDQVICLLQSRHAYVKAGELGLRVLIPAP
jgi:hypothetical protein